MTTAAQRISRTGLVFLVAYLLLAGAATYWQAIRSDELSIDPQANAGRLHNEAARTVRGRILDRNGAVLAEDVKDASGDRVRKYLNAGAVHQVGFHSARFGDSGIEAARAAALTGRAGIGALVSPLNDLLHLPQTGSDVRLTLDARLQLVAERALGSGPGALVALDPKTGEVLAMVSTPGFDPNRLDQQWSALHDSPAAPLLNRATQGLYSPGSTYKTVTLAAALEAGLVDAMTPIACPENMNVEGFIVRSRNDPPGRTTRTVRDAYAYSCNTAFAELGLKVGRARLTAMAEALGLRTAVPFDLPTEAGQVSNQASYLGSPQGLAVTAFGQGEILATPLHLALIAAAVANDGLVPTPRLVAGEPPAAWRRAMSPQTAKALAAIMEYGVGAGWASSGAVSGVRVAGKTGTAEQEQGVAPHAVFIGYAPVDDPKIAIAVLKERAGAGSTVAGPIMRAVLEAALR